jgi:sugar phosphate isomerase/epimerase
MVVASSSKGIVSMDNYNKSIDYLINGGFKKISLDFSMVYSGRDLESYGMGEDKDYNVAWKIFGDFVNRCEQKSLNIAIANAPFLPSGTKRFDLNGLLADITAKCIEYCGDIDCRYIVVPPIFAGLSRENAWNENHDYYMRLGRIALQHNVKILIKNLVANYNGRLVRGVCSEPYEAAEWIDKLNAEIGSECFGFCLDTCICNICCQDLYEYIVAIGKRIDAVVLRDSDGSRESRRLPFTCTCYNQLQTDWLSLIRGLRQIGFDGVLIMDYSESKRFWPLKLKKQFLALANDIGEYFKWQIGIENALRKYDKRVLFGAGKMCINYLKYYGKKYPPLFTCDNNVALWGTVVEGLDVKSPNVLKDIPRDCAIFICNVYYDEIKKQLLDMGLDNPIEYFNDECLYEIEKEI